MVRPGSRSFFKHEQAGVIDLVMCDHDPNTLYASTFEALRRTWGLSKLADRTAASSNRLMAATPGKTSRAIQAFLPTISAGSVLHTPRRSQIESRR